MDPRDVPSHSPAHTHSYFDGNPGLRSPPLSHDPSYGMRPGAFSMMGRRPGLPDFRGTLTHDPILSAQASLTSPGALHGTLPASGGGAGWWMPPHPHSHGLTPDYFTSHLPGGWLTHERDCALASHERLEECLYPSARSRSSGIMNGVSSSGGFGSGSGIFYPPPSSPQSMHSFVHQASPTSAGTKNVLAHWGSHGNHDGKSVLDLGDSHDLDMIPRLNRKLSNCSEENSDRESEMRPGDLPLYHKERVKDSGLKATSDFEKPKASNRFPENTDLRSGQKLQPLKTKHHIDSANSSSQRPRNLPSLNENSNIPTLQKSPLDQRNDSKAPVRGTEETHSSSNYAVNSEPSKSAPPKLQKVKSGPPPRLQVPKSILNKTEGIVPTQPEPSINKGKDLSTLLKEEMLKSTSNTTNSVKSILTEKSQSDVSSDVESRGNDIAEPKLMSTSKSVPVIQKASLKPPVNQPRIPSGKPPLLTHFHGTKFSEQDSSDDDSDTSNVSSGSESGSGSDDESEEGEEGENEESSGSDTDSEGSDEEDDACEPHEDDDDDDDDDVSMETQESGTSLKDESHSPSKRKVDESFSGSPRKRRRAVNEDAIQVPLGKGWRRQTRLRQVGAAGSLRGDVYYFAPCGKKLRTYPEVTRYLNKNGVTEITLENFSFSTKLHIGEFLECKEGTVFEPLSEEEVNRRKLMADEKARVKLDKLNKKKEKKQKQAEMMQKAMEAKLVRKAQRQAVLDAAKMAKREKAEARMRSKAMKQEALQAAREAKKERVRMLAEQKRLAKERAKEQRQMARLKKKEDAANAKYEDAMKKAKERELKRQQAVLLKQQEKEQKKQQQMMIRAIETQRKQEERERLKEEKKMEKKIQREKKLEQKRREMILARELKKPVEDMVLKDSKVLPALARVMGLKIPGGAFADLLMVQEFVHNFSEALDLDANEIPSLWEMQSSLLNDSSEDVFVPLCQSLLISALEDPGCEGPDSFTMLGVALSKVELNETNFSEVLRLFVISRNAGDPHPLADALLCTPFQALTMSDKAGVMAYLCNELLCSRTICKEIESSIEHMSNLRRDKWVVEGKIRKLKAIQAEKYPVVKVKKPPGRPRADANIADPEGENSMSNSLADDSVQGNEDDEEEEEEEEEDEDEDDDDDGEGGGDGTQSSEESDEEEDATEPTTQEELERRLKKFEKKHSQFRSKLFSSSHALRALCLGQDRYKRRYWILPHGGGVFVEGMETAEKEIVLDLMTECLENFHAQDVKAGTEFDSVKQEHQGDPTKSGMEYQTLPETSLKSPCHAGLKSPLKSPPHMKADNRDNASVMSGNSMLSEGNNIQSQSTQQRLDKAYIPSAASRNAMEIQRIENLFRNESSSSKLASQSHSRAPKPQEKNGWFNVLPRMPCDESSLTLSHTHNSGNFVPTYSKRGGDMDLSNTPPTLKRPPGRPPRISNLSDGQAGPSSVQRDAPGHSVSIQYLPQLPVKRPPGRPPKSSYQTFNLTCFDGNNLAGAVPTATVAASTQSVSTMSLSFEELKRNVLESLMQEPAPIPPELQHGWWRITEPSHLKEIIKILHTRGIREKILQKNCQKYNEYANSSCTKGDQVDSDSDEEEEENETSSNNEPKKDTPVEDRTFPHVAFAVDKAILREVEEMEEKVFTASLQIKGWRLPPKASKGLSRNSLSDLKPLAEEGPLGIAISRLASLERGIERRYLKHPLRNDKLQIPSNIGTAAAPGEVPSGEEGQPKEAEKMEVNVEMVTPALKIWRDAVLTAQSAAQLSMCLSMLYDCVAWEKSIMKVFCQICRKGDNEELLLLCDGCDRGYHTYCCMPKLLSIPEGDWYCTDCIVLAAGGDNCCMCGGATGKMAKCDNCPRNFHLQCLEPPLSKVPRASWTCPTCKRKRSKPRRKRKIKEKEEEEEELDYSMSPNPPAKEEVRPHANRKQSSKDMAPCRLILAEMEKHEDAWPFLIPVNAKQFPEYYRIIRRPMDFHTMKIKLRDCQYTGPCEFVDDARTVFLNCEEFNEDDSEVGQAGKRLSQFFERRWEELALTID